MMTIPTSPPRNARSARRFSTSHDGARSNTIPAAQFVHQSSPPNARNPLDRVLSTQAHHPRRSNPHSARGTTTRSPIAVSFLGGFRTPAAQVCGTAVNGRHPKPFTKPEILKTSKSCPQCLESGRPGSNHLAE
jgi:hypothetical protein